MNKYHFILQRVFVGQIYLVHANFIKCSALSVPVVNLFNNRRVEKFFTEKNVTPFFHLF
jgi:hypothetical protein